MTECQSRQIIRGFSDLINIKHGTAGAYRWRRAPNRLADRDMKLMTTDGAKTWLAETGYDAAYRAANHTEGRSREQIGSRRPVRHVQKG